MRCPLLICSALLIASVASGQGATPARAGQSTLSTADRTDARNRLVALLEHTDIGNPEALYNAQQDGMALVEAIFDFGSDADRRDVMAAAASLVEKLPIADSLASGDLVAATSARLASLSPMLSRALARLGALRFTVDNLALPAGPARQRRVFPIIVGDRINVQSEVELQYAYLLSTIVRSAALHPVARGAPEAGAMRTALDSVLTFLVRDKVRFYWIEMPAWHWSRPFQNMRERVAVKLDDRDPRVRQPPWYGAILDHELLLFAIAADVRAAVRADASLGAGISRDDAAMLEEIWGETLRTLRTRVTSRDGQGFLFDYGRWTVNTNYVYAGCETRSPMPAAPCPVDSVAPDASHARRWPWWLRSMQQSVAPTSADAGTIRQYQRRLAHQFASAVLYTDSAGRPLLRNYMDGRDGWYRLERTSARRSGQGPSSMSGVMRYGSWALLSPLEPRIRAASRRFCAVLVSTDPADVAFRTRYYGSASASPDMAGLGDRDMYARAGSLSTLTCRIDAALGLD